MVTANNIGPFVNPVAGGVITFTASPATDGASVSLSATTAAVTGGQASVTATADTVAGSYTVTASAAGAPPASFSLTNTLGARQRLRWSPARASRQQSATPSACWWPWSRTPMAVQFPASP